MGFLSFFQTIAESKELHTDLELRSRYYKTNYRKVKAVILEYAKAKDIHVKNIDDDHKELFLQGGRFHIICSIVQVNPYETSADFKVEVYGIVGFGKPKKLIVELYKYLDSNLMFKGVGLHP